MSKGNGTRSVKGTNFWLQLKEDLKEGIKNQWLAFKCNLANNLVYATIYFIMLFMALSILEKVLLKNEDWLNVTAISSVLSVIPWLFKGTIIVKIVYHLEEMFLLIEFSVIFILGVLLNYSIDYNITMLVYFNWYLILSFANNLVVAILERNQQSNTRT